jgi:hypothetical protein
MKTLHQIAAVIIVLCHGSLGDSGEVYCKDAGIPECVGSDCYEIPAHNVIFSMGNNGTCIGGPFTDSCAGMLGGVHDGYSTAECDKKAAYAMISG